MSRVQKEVFSIFIKAYIKAYIKNQRNTGCQNKKWVGVWGTDDGTNFVQFI